MFQMSKPHWNGALAALQRAVERSGKQRAKSLNRLSESRWHETPHPLTAVVWSYSVSVKPRTMAPKRRTAWIDEARM